MKFWNFPRAPAHAYTSLANLTTSKVSRSRSQPFVILLNLRNAKLNFSRPIGAIPSLNLTVHLCRPTAEKLVNTANVKSKSIFDALVCISAEKNK